VRRGRRTSSTCTSTGAASTTTRRTCARSCRERSTGSARRHDAIVLAHGLCGEATAGLRAGSIPLVVPRSHDCITIFLGSRDRYTTEFTGNPGTYW